MLAIVGIFAFIAIVVAIAYIYLYDPFAEKQDNDDSEDDFCEDNPYHSDCLVGNVAIRSNNPLTARSCELEDHHLSQLPSSAFQGGEFACSGYTDAACPKQVPETGVECLRVSFPSYGYTCVNKDLITWDCLNTAENDDDAETQVPSENPAGMLFGAALIASMVND